MADDVVDKHQLLEAAAKAEHFLVGRMVSEAGLSDFNEANEWIPLLSLAHLGRDVVQTHGRSLARRLAAIARNGGWGYSGLRPPDCDSTAWGLHALSGTGIFSSANEDLAVRFVESHQQPDGGFATYIPKYAAEVLVDDSRDGWFTSQPCVSAVSGLALQPKAVCAASVARCCAFLSRMQRPDGLWSSYWWNTDLYATYFAAILLLRSGNLPRKRLERTISSCLQTRTNDGGWPDGPTGIDSSAVSTSFALRTLLLDHRWRPEATHVCLWLIKRQNSDGSFPASPSLRAPGLEAFTSLCGSGVFATSCVLGAFRAFLARRFGIVRAQS